MFFIHFSLFLFFSIFNSYTAENLQLPEKILAPTKQLFKLRGCRSYYTQRDFWKAVRLREGGFTYRKIADKLNVASLSTIKTWIKRYKDNKIPKNRNITPKVYKRKPRGSYQTYNEQDVEKAAQLRMEGLSFKKIAAKLGAPTSTIKSWLRKGKVDKSKKDLPTTPPKAYQVFQNTENADADDYFPMTSSMKPYNEFMPANPNDELKITQTLNEDFSEKVNGFNFCTSP